MASPDLSDPEVRATKLRELAEKDPSDAATWFTLGRTLLDLEREVEAVDAFRRALVADPNYTAAHRDLGRALLETDQAEEAAQVLAGALDLADRNGDLQTRNEMEVFLRRAERALGREQTPRSARAAGPAKSLPSEKREANPQARAIYKEGFEHFANDRHDEAIACYHRALAVDPGLAIAWNGISLAYRQKGELDSAVEAGKRLIELEPDDPLSHTNLSILLQRQGLIPEAEEEKAIAMQLQMKAQRNAKT